MSKQEILDYVMEYVRNNFSEQVKNPTPDTKLLTSKLLDSISTLHMVSHMEEKFKFEAEAHEVSPDNLDTPAIIAAYISGKIGA
jgi:acyl carrier protein